MTTCEAEGWPGAVCGGVWLCVAVCGQRTQGNTPRRPGRNNATHVSPPLVWSCAMITNGLKVVSHKCAQGPCTRPW